MLIHLVIPAIPANKIVNVGRLDPEKIADCPVTQLTMYGVNIISRYSHALEFQTMVDFIAWLEPRDRKYIVEMMCDSKSDQYSFRVNEKATQENMAIILSFFFNWHKWKVGQEVSFGLYIENEKASFHCDVSYGMCTPQSIMSHWDRTSKVSG
jgi:hypothetical protein